MKTPEAEIKAAIHMKNQKLEISAYIGRFRDLMALAVLIVIPSFLLSVAG